MIIPANGFNGVLTTCCTGGVNIPIGGLVYTSGTGGMLASFVGANGCSHGHDFCAAVSPSVSVLVSDGLREVLFRLSNYSSGTITSVRGDLSRGNAFAINSRVGSGVARLF